MQTSAEIVTLIVWDQLMAWGPLWIRIRLREMPRHIGPDVPLPLHYEASSKEAT